MKSLSCGLEICSPIEICSSLKFASDHGFEFVCVPLVHPRFKREFVAKWKDRSGPFTRPDLVLNSSEWSSLIAGKISPYLNTESEFLNGQARLALEQELNYGSHLDVPTVVIPLRSSRCLNLARIINSNLITVKSFQIWLEIPLFSHERNASAWRSDLNEKEPEESTWEWWNYFHILCNSNKRLGVILEITKTLPDEKELKRWMGEPVKCLVISTSTFLTNKTGYPVLSRPIQSFIKSWVPAGIQVIIRGNNHHKSLHCYQKYLDHLWQEVSAQKNLEVKDQPSNKNPVQFPLESFNHFDLSTWKIFEENSVKYGHYAKALYQAILDQVNKDKKNVKTLNIMVVGAGRGPMVLATLGAAAKSDQKVKIYAVEKNPHDVVALQAYQAEFWQDLVEIIFEDIKFLNFPQIIDIIVSDSLGSFGDNELLPEILGIAQKFLKNGGVSIPESYTSYICPVQCRNSYGRLKIAGDLAREIPYDLALGQTYSISPIKSLFSFNHPSYSEPIDNSRYKKLSFEVDQNCILHGFTGFFDVVLHGDVKLSSHADLHNPELNSWNPVFFPLLEPVHLKTGDQIEVHFWRLVGKTNVWYEWTVTKPIPLPVHNPNGRSSCMSLG